MISWALRTAPTYLRALVLYYTILEVKARPEDEATTTQTEKLIEYSPVDQLKNAKHEALPIFVARAGLDRPALNETIDKFIETALSKNGTLDLSNHEMGQHGFDVQNDDERSRQIIKRTIDFIQLNSMK